MTKSDYYTHCHDLPPQLGGCQAESSGELVRAEVDGKAWQPPGGTGGDLLALSCPKRIALLTSWLPEFGLFSSHGPKRLAFYFQVVWASEGLRLH